MGRGKGQQEDWPKTRDILPWLWQRPWNMLRGKKSPWRFIKAAHYYYFADVFLPLHKPWGPFTFPERPTRWNLTLKWEEININGGLQFSEEGGGLYAKGPHNTATTPCCSQFCELIFSKNLLTTSRYHLCPNPSCFKFWFWSIFPLDYCPNKGFWMSVLISQRGKEMRGRQILNTWVYSMLTYAPSFPKQNSVD